ncbi:MAG: glycoside hydrolase family 2 protein, partial [Bifidobacteriaceae bacterium]|nr:glycoside hydrolase family 2 protein [Bifidobacteriaceae bacterium]
MRKSLKTAIGLVAGLSLIPLGPALALTPPPSRGLVDAAASPVHTVADDGTRDVDFNEDWQFLLVTRTPTGPANSLDITDPAEYPSAAVAASNYDDSSWRTLTVPHDWAIEGAKVSVDSAGSSQGYMQGGLGWYRKTFTVPESVRTASKRVMIDFEGVYQNSVVYLNGVEIGNYPSGYTGFSYDLTEKLNYGSTPNVLAVKVQSRAASGRWYTGAGITRPVRLVITEPVRIVREGVTLTTPALETTYGADRHGELNVAAKVYSDTTNGTVRLRTTVIDAAGTQVATKTADWIPINPTSGTTLVDTVSVPNVNLWYPWIVGTPYLYTVRTEVIFEHDGTTDAHVTDSVTTKFGFRWVEIAPTDVTDLEAQQTSGGLYVNGVYTKVQGVDLHHDSGALGGVSIKDAYERQFTILKSEGVNAYRTSHCPPSKQVIEVASELGFFVAEEAYDGWGGAKATYDFGRVFLTTVPTDWAGFSPNGMSGPPDPGVTYAGVEYMWSDWVIQQMVRRDVNEASVIMWSIGNEMGTIGTRPAWYDATKYNPLGVSGITETTWTNYGYYSEAVRLGEDVRAADPQGRPIVLGDDSYRSPPTLDSDGGRVIRYLDGSGLNYNTAGSVDVLTSRFGQEGPTQTFFYESESSSQTSSRGVYLDAAVHNSGTNQTPGRRGGSNYDNDFASWTMSNEYGLKKDRDRKSFIGQFIWSGFDYIGEPTPYSLFPVGVSSFGTIDTAGFPKDSYYLFRSQWTNKTTDPLVHILPGNWNSAKWQVGEPVQVWVNSNHQTVELFLNGTSLGTKSFDVKKT